MTTTDVKILTLAADLPGNIETLVAEALDWYADAPRLPLEDFIDRLCFDGLNPLGLDIEDLDCPATRAIMNLARTARRQASGS